MAKRVFLILIFMLFSVLAIVDLASANITALEHEVSSQLLEATPWNEADVEIDSLDLRGYSSATDSFDAVRVTLPRPIMRAGKVTVSVSLYRGGIEFKKFWASARVRLFKDAVVAINPLRKGHEIMIDDIELIRAEQRGSQSITSSVDEVLGMTARRPINPGDIIKRSYITPMKLVKRGEIVTLKIETERLRVSSQGKAMQNGARGEVISARTLSGKEIFGTVTGPGELRVAF
ncbi:MAG: flagellar basal body P-ring formation protein FlgA [Proteobacteria bacterium]|nr:flagellar basal body P-ring formation protein FlgA [Pseudomonadota bacterium]